MRSLRRLRLRGRGCIEDDDDGNDSEASKESEEDEFEWDGEGVLERGGRVSDDEGRVVKVLLGAEVEKAVELELDVE